jgi:hypothetical protein
MPKACGIKLEVLLFVQRGGKTDIDQPLLIDLDL